MLTLRLSSSYLDFWWTSGLVYGFALAHSLAVVLSPPGYPEVACLKGTAGLFSGSARASS